MIPTYVFSIGVEGISRLLARRPRPAREIVEARNWVVVSAETFRSVLEPEERGFVGLAFDGRSAVLGLSFAREWGSAARELSADALRKFDNVTRRLR